MKICIDELAMGEKVKAALAKKRNEVEARLESAYLGAIGANVNISRKFVLGKNDR